MHFSGQPIVSHSFKITVPRQQYLREQRLKQFCTALGHIRAAQQFLNRMHIITTQPVLDD
jgi:hypothetical protein